MVSVQRIGSFQAEICILFQNKEHWVESFPMASPSELTAGRGWTRWPLKLPFNLKHSLMRWFCDSVNHELWAFRLQEHYCPNDWSSWKGLLILPPKLSPAVQSRKANSSPIDKCLRIRKIAVMQRISMSRDSSVCLLFILHTLPRHLERINSPTAMGLKCWV